MIDAPGADRTIVEDDDQDATTESAGEPSHRILRGRLERIHTSGELRNSIKVRLKGSGSPRLSGAIAGKFGKNSAATRTAET
jgi:hypothetical protein